MWSKVVLASALARPALVLVLTNAVLGGCGGDSGGDGGDGGDGGGDGGGGAHGGGDGGGGGAGHLETGPATPVRVIAQEHTVPPWT